MLFPPVESHSHHCQDRINLHTSKEHIHDKNDLRQHRHTTIITNCTPGLQRRTDVAQTADGRSK